MAEFLLEKGVESGSKLASDAGNATSGRGCAGVLVFTLLLIDITKGRGRLDGVLSAGRGGSHGFYGLLSGENCIFISGVDLDSNGLGGEKTLDERVDRARILPTGGLEASTFLSMKPSDE